MRGTAAKWADCRGDVCAPIPSDRVPLEDDGARFAATTVLSWKAPDVDVSYRSVHLESPDFSATELAAIAESMAIVAE